MPPSSKMRPPRFSGLPSDRLASAASAPHDFVATIEPLERLAEECDIITTDRPTMAGPGVEFAAAIDEIEALIKLSRARWLGLGMAIQELETRQVFMDGGQSYEELITAFRAVNGRLQAR